MTRLRIGIDATCWHNQRGFGRFTRQLLTAMFDQVNGADYVVFTDFAAPPEMDRDNIRVVRVATSSSVTDSAVADDSRKISDILAFRAAVRAQTLDVMYFPAVYSWYPSGGRAPVVVTFHDAIAEHFPALVMPSWRGRLFWRAKTWLARRTAARLTTVSMAARAEIVEFFGVEPGKVDVILEAADPIFVPVDDDARRSSTRSRLALPEGQALLVYVGGMAPHKNLLGLLRGFALAIGNSALDHLDLVFVGDPEGAGFHSNTRELVELIESSAALRHRVHFTGFVSDEDLVTLYSDALAVAMPAFSEGFGLPAAEAIACGTPVIAARGGAVEEVVGSAGLYFDPRDIGEIAQAITTVGSDEVAMTALRARCLPRAAEMSWARAAEQTLDVLRSVAGTH